MEQSKNWEKIRQKVKQEANTYRQKRDKRELISQYEAAVINEDDLYEAMDQVRAQEAQQKIETKPIKVDATPTQDIKKTPDQQLNQPVDSSVDQLDSQIFNIHNHDQQIERLKEGRIYYAEQKGRVENLNNALINFESANQELLENYQDKEILIKVNLVDPDYAQACSQAEAVKNVIQWLKKFKPKKIWIGDIPSAMGKRNRSWNELRKTYEENLDYQFGNDAELINLEELPETTIRQGSQTFKVKNLDGFGGIINLSKPKMHGEFGFTGCTKNLMGFLNQDDREKIIHMQGDGEYQSAIAHSRLKDFSTALLKYRPDIINVSDGYDFVIGHEHIGTTKKTDFAMISRDPINMDNEAQKLLGLNAKTATYLVNNDFPKQDGKLLGEMRQKNLHPSELRQAILPYEAKTNGALSMIHVINDPNFINHPETKKRVVFTVLDSLLAYLKENQGQDQARAKRSVLQLVKNNRNDYAKFLAGALPVLAKDNPYQEMPDFSHLCAQWARSR
jgi:uncharacterized protein (DUF362 family)